jgi:fructoselysine 3-epimerase
MKNNHAVTGVKFSVVSSLFVNYGIRDAILQVAKMGFNGIDIWGGRPHVYRQDYSQADLRELKALIEDLNLAVPSFMPAFFRYPYSLSNPNKVVRLDSIDYVRQCLDNAILLGAPILLIIPGKCLHGQPRDEAAKLMIDSIHEVCQHAAPYDIWLGLEPANQMVTDLVNNSRDAMDVIHAVGYSKLGVVLDTGHMSLTREPIELAVQILGSNLLQFHINDNDGQRQQNLIPGDGTYDFGRFAETLRAVNYQGFVSVELGWDYAAMPEQALSRVERFLTNLFEIKPAESAAQHPQSF